MLRNIPPSAHLLFLGLIVLLRIPSFITGVHLSEESLYMACGQHIGEGHLYIDVWFGGPPFMVWFYGLCQYIFGDGALTVVKIFSILYLYICSLYFQALITNYRVFKRQQYTPALFFIILSCIPWYTQQFSAAILMLYPLLFAFHTILRMGESQSGNYRRLFITGILLFVCILADYHALMYLVGIALAYFGIRQAKVDEFFGMLLGLGVGLLVFVLFLYFNGIGKEFWQIGILSFFQNWLTEPPSSLRVERIFAWRSVLIHWSPLILLAVFGFAHFRTKLLNYVIVIRQVEQVMLIWLLCGIVIIFASSSQLHLADFYSLCPPIAFYAAKAFSFKMWRVLRISWISSMVLIVLHTGLHISSLVATKELHVVRIDKIDLFLGSRSYLPKHEKLLANYFEDKSFPHGIWLLADRPALYPFLGASAANRYIDFSVTIQQLPYFGQEANASTATEKEAELFKRLKQNLPDYIIDQKAGFANMRKRFPSLLDQYEVEAVGPYTVWAQRKP